MTTVLERLLFAPAAPLLAWFSPRARRRRGLVDLRELPPYLQRDIGLLDGEEAIARRRAASR